MKKNLYVVEGIAGVWHYHISETGENMQPALCGESKVMLTELPLKAWGTKGHLNETYCKKCSELYGRKSHMSKSKKIKKPSSQFKIVRILHMMKDGDLQSEQLSITEDLDAPAGDFLPPGYKLVSDTKHDMELPHSFPINNDWVRFG